MDTTHRQITFDADGVCSHCRNFETFVLPNWDTGAAGRASLERQVEVIKRAGRGREVDCILGLSGGLDSSYLLHVMVKDFGLRPLVFHVDGGWDSELAVHNIEVLIDGLGIDLFTEVIDWEEMKDFQLAWFKSGLPHIDIPQDHAFVAALYRFAARNGIRFILNGGNYSTEVVPPPMQYFYYGTDMAQIRDVVRRFGTIEMRNYPFSSIYRHKIYLRYLRGLRVVKPLNFLPYRQRDAIEVLSREYGWREYPQKHFESIFTRFYEGYWLPNRFGFDIRRIQWSSLIQTGQMVRDDALHRLASPSLSDDVARRDFDYVAAKLCITKEQLKDYETMPLKFYWNYRNQKRRIDLGAKALRLFGTERSIKE